MSEGARPRIEGNEIRANAKSGIVVRGAGSDPLVQANRIHNGQGDGIWIDEGASPTISGNTITGNSLEPIHVDEGSAPKIDQNIVTA